MKIMVSNKNVSLSRKERFFLNFKKLIESLGELDANEKKMLEAFKNFDPSKLDFKEVYACEVHGVDKTDNCRVHFMHRKLFNKRAYRLYQSHECSYIGSSEIVQGAEWWLLEDMSIVLVKHYTVVNEHEDMQMEYRYHLCRDEALNYEVSPYWILAELMAFIDEKVVKKT